MWTAIVSGFFSSLGTGLYITFAILFLGLSRQRRLQPLGNSLVERYAAGRHHFYYERHGQTDIMVIPPTPPSLEQVQADPSQNPTFPKPPGPSTTAVCVTGPACFLVNPAIVVAMRRNLLDMWGGKQGNMRVFIVGGFFNEASENEEEIENTGRIKMEKKSFVSPWTCMEAARNMYGDVTVQTVEERKHQVMLEFSRAMSALAPVVLWKRECMSQDPRYSVSPAYMLKSCAQMIRYHEKAAGFQFDHILQFRSDALVIRRLPDNFVSYFRGLEDPFLPAPTFAPVPAGNASNKTRLRSIFYVKNILFLGSRENVLKVMDGVLAMQGEEAVDKYKNRFGIQDSLSAVRAVCVANKIPMMKNCDYPEGCEKGEKDPGEKGGPVGTWTTPMFLLPTAGRVKFTLRKFLPMYQADLIRHRKTQARWIEEVIVSQWHRFGIVLNPDPDGCLHKLEEARGFAHANSWAVNFTNITGCRYPL